MKEGGSEYAELLVGVQFDSDVKMKVAVLRDALKKNGLDTVGKKLDLQTRLHQEFCDKAKSTSTCIAKLAGSDGPSATPVCDWDHLDFCKLKDAEGPASLIPCAVNGCHRFLHHMCQTEWECLDDSREAHGTRKLCAHHHPSLAMEVD